MVIPVKSLSALELKKERPNMVKKDNKIDCTKTTCVYCDFISDLRANFCANCGKRIEKDHFFFSSRSLADYDGHF